MKLRALLLLFIALFLFASEEKVASYEILQPIDKSVVTESFVTVTLDIKKQPIDAIEIVVNEKRKVTLTPEAGKEVYCKTVAVKPGENHLSIAVYNNGSKMGEATRSIFHVVEVVENAEEEFYGYKRYAFHTNKSEKRCISCHSFDGAKSKVKVPEDAPEPDGITIDVRGETFLVPEDPTEVSCYQCHKQLLSRKNSHAPAVNLICGECHNGDSGEFDEGENLSKLSAPDPIMEQCFSCHENSEKTWFNHRSEHGPTKTGRCTMCHNPHGSDNEFFLRKPIWNLCTTCHAEKASGKHVVSSFVFSRNEGAHPTRGRQDPSRPGRELVCSSCHNPHGSQGVFLLRSKGALAFNVCRRCHKK